MIGDAPVKVSTQELTYRDTVTLAGAGPIIQSVGDAWYVYMLPRQFLWFNQTSGAIPASVLVEWAIRDSATPGTPEWLRLASIACITGGTTPVLTNLTTGAVWLRFTVEGRAGDVVELACTAFL